MNLELTKDAEKMICSIYKVYQKRRKTGASKQEAEYFDEKTIAGLKPMSGWMAADIAHTLLELGQKGYLKIFIGGDCRITDLTVCEMENRFKNGIKDAVDVTSSVLSFIP